MEIKLLIHGIIAHAITILFTRIQTSISLCNTHNNMNTSTAVSVRLGGHMVAKTQCAFFFSFFLLLQGFVYFQFF
jgi:hypothetical protein